ncbi:MAG: hypothetical protein ACFFE4_02185 [Candidatus Thorarchaeota archaeon]
MEQLEKEGDIEAIIVHLENKMFLVVKELRFEDIVYLRDKVQKVKKSYKIIA